MADRTYPLKMKVMGAACNACKRIIQAGDPVLWKPGQGVWCDNGKCYPERNVRGEPITDAALKQAGQDWGHDD